MKELAKITITVEEEDVCDNATSRTTRVRGFSKELDEFDRADIVRHLCKCLNTTPAQVILWDRICKAEEEIDQ